MKVGKWTPAKKVKRMGDILENRETETFNMVTLSIRLILPLQTCYLKMKQKRSSGLSINMCHSKGGRAQESFDLGFAFFISDFDTLGSKNNTFKSGAVMH